MHFCLISRLQLSRFWILQLTDRSVTNDSVMNKIISVLLFFLAGFFGIAHVSVATTPAVSAQLDFETLPAKGRQSAMVNVGKFGRYAVLAQSAQGTALQLIDRMAGPGEIAGIAGEQDGRLDLFLNRGDYKIITHAPQTGIGDVKLLVHSYTELHANNFPQLIKLRFSTTLVLDIYRKARDRRHRSGGTQSGGFASMERR